MLCDSQLSHFTIWPAVAFGVAMLWLLQWLFYFVGHVGFCCVAYNRIHATALPRRFRKRTEIIIILITAVPIGWSIINILFRSHYRFGSSVWLIRYYMLTCVGMGVFFLFRWMRRRYWVRLPDAIQTRNRKRLDMRPHVQEPFFHGWLARLLGKLPLNEVTQLTLEQMTFGLDVPSSLDGLKICQLSDLHFTGQISIEYFQAVVEQVNQFDPDLILITGDIIDESVCLPWFESTLGRLQARHGIYYVLGNHDKRLPDESELRQRLESFGLRPAAGCWHVIEINGAKIALTGNELPWFGGAEQLPPPEQQPASDLAILLSHSPDQIDWARRYRFNLMFAGHTHGGQIALPIVGPIVAPSKYGVKYASGTFQIDDMLMHVSRGISGDEPVRFNSPPELGQFVIHGSRKS